MPWLRLLLAFLSLLLVLYAALPWLAEQALARWLGEQRIQVADLKVGYPTLTGWSLPHIRLAHAEQGWNLNAQQLSLYLPEVPGSFTQARPQIAIQRLQLRLQSGAAGADQPLALPALSPQAPWLAWLSPAAWPLETLEVRQLEVLLSRPGERWRLAGELEIRQQRLRLEGELRHQPAATGEKLPTLPPLQLRSDWSAAGWNLQAAPISQPPLATLSASLPSSQDALSTGTLELNLPALANWLAPWLEHQLPRLTPDIAALMARLTSPALQGRLQSHWTLSPAGTTTSTLLEQSFNLTLNDDNGTLHLAGSSRWHDTLFSWQLDKGSTLRYPLWPWLPEPVKSRLKAPGWRNAPLQATLDGNGLRGSWNLENQALQTDGGALTLAWAPAPGRERIGLALTLPAQPLSNEAIRLGARLHAHLTTLALDDLRLNNLAIQGRAQLAWSPSGLAITLQRPSSLEAGLSGLHTEVLPLRLSLQAPLHLAPPWIGRVHVQLAPLSLSWPDASLTSGPVDLSLAPFRLDRPRQRAELSTTLTPTVPGWQVPPVTTVLTLTRIRRHLQLQGVLTNPSRQQIEVEGEYDLDRAQGQLRWQLPSQDAAPLLNWWKQRPAGLRMTRGRLQGEGELTLGGSGWRQQARFELADSDGLLDKTVWSGLHAQGVLSQSASDTWNLAAVTRAATINPGFPIENLQTRYLIEQTPFQPPLLSLREASAELLGGRVWSAPATLDLQSGQGTLDLIIHRIGLQQLLALEQRPELQGSGQISGHLPLSLNGYAGQMRQGKLVAEAPGGWIRYQAPPSIAAGNPHLGEALKALENFIYQELSLTADYERDGTLTLAATLQGRNPNWQRGRPVNLNLTVEENLLQLLRSLQASERFTRSLEKRVRERSETAP